MVRFDSCRIQVGGTIDGRSGSAASEVVARGSSAPTLVARRCCGLPGGGWWAPGLDSPRRHRAAYAVGFAPGGRSGGGGGEVEREATGRLDVWDVATGRQILSTVVPGRAARSGLFAGRLIRGHRRVDRESLCLGIILPPDAPCALFSGLSYPVRGLAFAMEEACGRGVGWGRDRGGRDRWRRAFAIQPRTPPAGELAGDLRRRSLPCRLGEGFGIDSTSLWNLETGRPEERTALAGTYEPVALPRSGILAARGPGGLGAAPLTSIGIRASPPSRPGWSAALLSPDGHFLAARQATTGGHRLGDRHPGAVRRHPSAAFNTGQTL